MSKFNHFLVGMAPVAMVLAFEGIFRKPANIYWLAVVLVALVFFTIWQLTGQKFSRRFWLFLAPPAILVISELLFILSLQGVGFWRTMILGFSIVFDWRRTVIWGLTLILAVFLENIYVYHFQPDKYQKYSLANIANYFNLITLFLFNASLFLLLIFLQFPLWLAIILNFLATALLTYQTFWINRFKFDRSWSYIFCLPLISAELFWTASFLPLSIYNQALLIILAYYLMIGLARNNLLGILDKKVVGRYAGVAAGCLAVILLTAKYR